MATKAFGKRTAPRRGPIPFLLHDQEFHVKGHMAGLRVLNLFSAMDSLNERDSAVEMRMFIEKALTDEDRERGMAYLTDSEPPLELSDLIEIISWLVSVYSGNDGNPSVPSTDGPTTTGTGSTGMPVSAESISATNGSMPLITSPSS
jgi:hypothetical protein